MPLAEEQEQEQWQLQRLWTQPRSHISKPLFKRSQDTFHQSLLSRAIRWNPNEVLESCLHNPIGSLEKTMSNLDHWNYFPTGWQSRGYKEKSMEKLGWWPAPNLLPSCFEIQIDLQTKCQMPLSKATIPTAVGLQGEKRAVQYWQSCFLQRKNWIHISRPRGGLQEGIRVHNAMDLSASPPLPPEPAFPGKPCNSPELLQHSGAWENSPMQRKG